MTEPSPVETAERLRGEQRDWYLRTQHCGACGQPGIACLCVTPCGCKELHEVGSGIGLDVATAFADHAPAAAGDDQPELFA